MASYWGHSLGKVTLKVSGRPGAFAIQSKDAAMVDVAPATRADDAVMSAVSDAHQATLAYVRQKVGTAVGHFAGGSEGARFVDGALADLINAVQVETATKAGYPVALSASAVLSNVGLPQGDVLLKDLFAIYPYENALFVEMTGAVLRQALVENATFYPVFTAQTPPITISPTKPTYDYDFFTGLDYAYDFSVPAGPTRLTKADFGGQPISDAAKFLVAVNSFRARGTGNPAFANAVVKWESPKSMREYLLEYVQAHPQLDPEVVNVCNFTSAPDVYGAFIKASYPAKCAP